MNLNPYRRLPVPTEILALADHDSMLRKELPDGRVLEIPVMHESDPTMTPHKAQLLIRIHLAQLGVTP